VEIPYGMMDSMTFHVDSRGDGITKMGGIPAKHIPYGMGGIHLECHGFHMDSMWNMGGE
jgi:hypothetical protein